MDKETGDIEARIGASEDDNVQPGKEVSSHLHCAKENTKCQQVIVNTTSNPPERTPEEKALVWKQDLRIVPLCAAIYLLCYLDRSNIGNAKTLNSSTHHDLLSTTHMTNYQYM